MFKVLVVAALFTASFGAAATQNNFKVCSQYANMTYQVQKGRQIMGWDTPIDAHNYYQDQIDNMAGPAADKKEAMRIFDAAIRPVYASFSSRTSPETVRDLTLKACLN